MPFGDWERPVAGLGGLRIGDVTALVPGLRMVNSEVEVGKLAHICVVGSATFAAKRWSRGLMTRPVSLAAPRMGGYGDVISPPTSRQLETGDVQMMDTGCSWDGYC